MTEILKPVHELPAKFGHDSLIIDAALEVEQICNWLIEVIFKRFHKHGGVVGISGGIDSSVVLALTVKALGADRVIGVLLPERESSPESSTLAQELAKRLEVQTTTEYISAALEGYGCYKRRDEAITRVIPEYQPGWGAKIILPSDLLERQTMNLYRLVVTSPDGQEINKRLPLREYQQIVAASNLKQRARMSILYYHAEGLNYAVVGTTNKNEHDLGFFVKWGDGGVDINPIRHLFKTQIYQIAKHLDIMEEIQKRIPTTDTYPGGSTQEEFFYRIPFDILDTIWLGYERKKSNVEIAEALGLTAEQVAHVVADLESKKRGTAYLRFPPVSYISRSE